MEFYDPEVLSYYSSMARGFQPEPYNYFQPIFPQQTALETEINMEMQSKKAEFAREEDIFVEQMMEKQPIVVEKRKSLLDQERSVESIQRAESCRKSRVNNKIKKAKMRFRHQFASQKMKESACLLNHIHEMIADAESQLLRRGFPVNKMHHLRAQFGVDCPAASSPSLCQGYSYQ